MNVLSLFDGMSCGQQALERVGIKVDNYFASEIDKYAITVTMANYPNTKQLGSVVNVDGYSLPKIDLLIGGSPCQSFSFAGKRKGMSTKDEQEILTLDHYLELKSQEYEFEGQSYLFWEYMRLLNEVKPKYFLLENVMMGEKWEKILSKAIGVNPIMINSSLVSAQNRQRLYWTNIGMKPSGLFGDLESTIEQPKDLGILLKDILDHEVDEKYFLKENSFIFDRIKNNHPFTPRIPNNHEKSNCLCIGGKGIEDLVFHNSNSKTIKQLNPSKESVGVQPYQQNRVYDIFGITPALCANKSDLLINSSKIRRLTPIECERLQTVKDNYTNHVSDSQRYKMLGNGWTVDVIAHIFKYI
jgi:DNA (cytosine-5)-methyltransferase 3A